MLLTKTVRNNNPIELIKSQLQFVVYVSTMLDFLENPKYPSLGPHLWLLSSTGLWHPKKTKAARFKIFILYATVCFFFTQYLKCVMQFQLESLELILQYAPFHIGIVKACFFQKQYATWTLLIDYLSSVECKQSAKTENKVAIIMKNYIVRNRRVTYFFWALAFFSNFTIFTEPYKKNRVVENGTSVYLNIFNGFTPFSPEPPGYYGGMAIQTILGHIVSAYVVGWDTMVISIMIFFAGQLKISHYYCTEVIQPKNPEKSHQNIAKCHEFYIQLRNHQRVFNSLISPVMFVYLIVISVNLGVCIIQIVELQDDIATLISSCLFTMACLIQLLLFYWYSNEVTQESLKVSYGTFESRWLDCDLRLQKEVFLLGVTTKDRLAFKAGPFNEMSLMTFVSILRSSYSFYTLLSRTN